MALLAAPSALWVRDAIACSCIGGVQLHWPPGESVDAPVDTPIVIGGEVYESMFHQDAGAPTGVDAGGGDGLQLISANGERVELTLERVLPATACVNAFHFASTGALLRVKTRYELLQGSTVVAAFTTGSHVRDPEVERSAAQRLSFEVLGTSADPKQITTAFVTQLERLPLYLNFTGSVAETTLFLPRVNGDSVQLNFGSLLCPEVRVLGADGELLVSRSLCSAERCLESDGTVVVSSCGGNYAVDVDYTRFRALPLGCPGDDEVTSEAASSDASATSSPRADSGLGQEEPQKVAVRPSERGCAINNATGNGRYMFALATMVAAWLRRRRVHFGRSYNQTMGTPS